MSERLTLRAYKGIDAVHFRATFDQVVESLGGRVFWYSNDSTVGRECRMAHATQVHVVYSSYANNEGRFYLKLGAVLERPWVQLDICEGALWQAIFYQGGEIVDRFSTAPQYWSEGRSDPDEVALWRGNPEVVAALWNVPLLQINRYMVDWGYYSSGDVCGYRRQGAGRAYPSDNFEYTDVWQMLDFLNALGGLDPMNLNKHGVAHRVDMPT